VVRHTLSVRALINSIVKTLIATNARFVDPVLPPVPPRKYYTLNVYSVGLAILLHSFYSNKSDTCTRRNTPSRVDTYTSPMPMTFRRRLILFRASLSCPSSALPAYPQGSYHIVLFTRKADVQPLIWGYKFMREIARRMPHFRGEPPTLHPAFSPGGPASVVAQAKGPVAFDTTRIVYSEEDERALEAFIRANGALLLRISASRAYLVALRCAGVQCPRPSTR
jgi:hypothetical protein